MTNDLLPGTEFEARGLRWELVDAQPAGAQQCDLQRTQYGLERAQCERVLSTFSHKSYPRAPELCLAPFDELKRLGLEPFCAKHDRYWGAPFVETRPGPVVDLRTREAASTAKPTKRSPKEQPTGQTELLFGEPDPSLAPAQSADMDHGSVTPSSAAPATTSASSPAPKPEPSSPPTPPAPPLPQPPHRRRPRRKTRQSPRHTVSGVAMISPATPGLAPRGSPMQIYRTMNREFVATPPLRVGACLSNLAYRNLCHA